MQTIKPVSKPRDRVWIDWQILSNFKIRIPTLIILGILSFFSSIAISWFLGNTYVTELFIQLHLIQENPPSWLTPPKWGKQYYLLIPTLVLFLLAQIVMKLSPKPKTWSRRLLAGVLFILVVRYLLWRSLTTLNLTNPADGIFSLTLLFMEIVAMASATIQLLLMFTVKDRKSEANSYSRAVVEKKYSPSVDILIPTYNEPDFILKRTIIGCQALNYEHKKIYVLDDTRRPQIRKLAKELGCKYFTRPDNSHAKAGNLNQAIARTNGDLIVVFDADFVPTTNFLERTIGFFVNPKVGLVQTPQSFYNSDPIAKNLGLEDVLTTEEELFYRQAQPIKDGAGSLVCAGTSFVVRREALQKIGNFSTDSICEDYFTGIRLSAKGYELVYLDEKLSAGLAAESLAAHIDQRLRWSRGTLQAFFIKSNPLTIPGLNLWQRLGHLELLFHWFTCIPRLFFLFVPIICIFGGLNPVLATAAEGLYMFVPLYAMFITCFAWLNERSRSALLADLYAILQAFPVAISVINVMFSPFSQGFKVTPKGQSRNRFRFNWSLAVPLIVFLIATIISFYVSITNIPSSGFNIGLWWSVYNLLTISVALITLLDIPQPSFYEWFSNCQQIKITSGNCIYYGVTQKISEEGMEVLLDPAVNLDTKITVEILGENLTLSGSVTRSYVGEKGYRAIIKFYNLTLPQHRSLINLLYCRPGQWQRRNAPGELQSIAILCKMMLRPLIFLNRKRASQLVKQY
ncbi:glycosyltransferase [Myxosarcina sp. GI1]|uniref:glycosyltransferase n=1 Tax=Myxosarcina sp. GI1 TaxID=1541065 RepID=UPI0009E0B292|nr:glycosyltransferase [Myxosarcina sp. GI1]